MVMMFASGCADTKVIDGVEYDTYGIVNASEKKNPDIEYRFVIGNAIWGVVLFETLIAPVYFYGFSIYEPVGKKSDNVDLPKGAIRKVQ